MMKKSVDGVMKGFTKTINDLRKIADRERTNVACIKDQIATLEEHKTVATIEADRAEGFANNIEGMLNGFNTMVEHENVTPISGIGGN